MATARSSAASRPPTALQAALLDRRASRLLDARRPLVERRTQTRLPTAHGDFEALAYRPRFGTHPPRARPRRARRPQRASRPRPRGLLQRRGARKPPLRLGEELRHSLELIDAGGRRGARLPSRPRGAADAADRSRRSRSMAARGEACRHGRRTGVRAEPTTRSPRRSSTTSASPCGCCRQTTRRGAQGSSSAASGSSSGSLPPGCKRRHPLPARRPPRRSRHAPRPAATARADELSALRGDRQHRRGIDGSPAQAAAAPAPCSPRSGRPLPSTEQGSRASRSPTPHAEAASGRSPRSRGRRRDPRRPRLPRSRPRTAQGSARSRPSRLR